MLAIAGALIGVMIMIYEPGALSFDPGLLYVLGAYTALAVGTVAIRRITDVDWRVYVAWTAVMMLILCVSATLLFETNHAEVWREDKLYLLIAAAYAAHRGFGCWRMGSIFDCCKPILLRTWFL